MGGNSALCLRFAFCAGFMDPGVGENVVFGLDLVLFGVISVRGKKLEKLKGRHLTGNTSGGRINGHVTSPEKTSGGQINGHVTSPEKHRGD